MMRRLARLVVMGMSAVATMPLLETCVIRVPDIRQIVVLGDEDDLEDYYDDREDFFEELEDLFD